MKRTVVLAFSGGLDTSYCAAWLREQGYAVHTVTVDTGGFDAAELAAIAARSAELHAERHVTIDARDELFDDYLRYLIYANALRGEVYPLCVSAERIAQARRCAAYAVQIGAAALAHGSTGAGNDQVRFDVAFRVFAPGVEILTPIRDRSLAREEESAYLAERGVEIPPTVARYSINKGLWGATIGGVETHRSDGVLPEGISAYAQDAPPAAPCDLRVEFARGVPAALDGERLPPVTLIERLNALGAARRIGRGVHVGDTILGIKGRVVFEAPAAVVLLAAHRELEKLVLSRQQQFWKRTLGELYGGMLHEGRFFDPLMRDLEAFLASSQAAVSGSVDVSLERGAFRVRGATSPHSLLNANVARYGESSSLWNGAEAAAFCKIFGTQDQLLHQLRPREEASDARVD